jgi:Fur family transcriptional regulator, ferric uptake regulator
MEQLGVGAFDRATVYRILADLAAAGLVRKMDLGDHVWRFELQDECRQVTPDHAHFLCGGCGDVTCLPPIEIRSVTGALPAVLLGAEIQLKVMGTCARCTG